MRINQEVGCIYDTLAFLSAFTKESIDGLSDKTVAETSAYYRKWEGIIKGKITVPNFLCLFFNRPKDACSFMHSVFFDRPYSECTYERLRLVMNNRLHMKKRFIAYHFPEADEPTINKLLTMDSHDVIDILIRRSMDSIQEIYFFYTFINFESVLQTLFDVVKKVYSEISDLRGFDLPAYDEFIKQESTFSKLKAITNTLEVSDADFTIALSLMESDTFLYHASERNFVLLGYDFEKRLDTDYKYSDVTLYSFAQAIGNPVKYDICNSLLTQSPMTSADLSLQLNLSRPALDYNLNEMVKSRLVLASPINKRTNNYSINNEYLKCVSRLLNVTLSTRFE